MEELYQEIIARAAAAIASADALLIGAGAGMGVDSGLPDFRGEKGFWQAYPPFRGRKYVEIANPRLFHEDPELAWGFYGHRMMLYRNTTPHEGFSILRRWAEELVGEHFVFTSNIDGHFQRSDYAEERVYEVHGSTQYLQCSRGLSCTKEVWSAASTVVAVNEENFRCTSDLPQCVHCSSVARPNTLMFGDSAWVPTRSVEQEDRFEEWYKRVKGSKVVAIEFGAGTAVPTVRYECHRRSKKLIRVNPRDFHASPEAISVPLGALETIRRIDAALTSPRFASVQ